MYAIQASDADILIAIVAIVPGTLAAVLAYVNGKHGKDVAAKLETGNGMGVGGYVVHLATELGGLDEKVTGLSEKVEEHAAALVAHTASDEENFAEIHEMLTQAAKDRRSVKSALDKQEKAS